MYLEMYLPYKRLAVAGYAFWDYVIHIESYKSLENKLNNKF